MRLDVRVDLMGINGRSGELSFFHDFETVILAAFTGSIYGKINIFFDFIFFSFTVRQPKL